MKRRTLKEQSEMLRERVNVLSEAVRGIERGNDELSTRIKKLESPPKYKYGDEPVQGYRILSSEFSRYIKHCACGAYEKDGWRYLIDTGSGTISLTEDEIPELTPILKTK